MGNSRLSQRDVITTAFIWSSVFLVFATGAVAFAVTSDKLFIFLIMSGFMTATLAADVYVTTVWDGASSYDTLDKPELHTNCASSDLCSAQSLSRDPTYPVPCFHIEQEVVPCRSFSFPLISRRLGDSRLMPPKHTVSGGVHSIEQHLGKDSRGYKEVTRSCQEADNELQPTRAFLMTRVQGVDISFEKTQQTYSVWHSNSCETGLNCSSDTPAIWKDTGSRTADGRRSGAISPVASLSPSSSKWITARGTEHRLPREVLLDSGSDEAATPQCSSSLFYDATRQHEELVRTREGGPSKANLGFLGNGLNKFPGTTHVIDNASTLSSVRTSTMKEGLPRGKEDNSYGKQKRKLKLFSRLFKRKKEFTHFKSATGNDVTIRHD